jgi:protein required for attachment to host cells
MHVGHGASVFVTDGCKALFLRNDGDSDFPDLRLLQRWEQSLPPDRDFKSSGPGRTFGSYGHGSRRSSYQETDFHALAEAEFAAHAAEFLNEKAQSQGIEKLIIVAPPRTLGLVRKGLCREAEQRLFAEIPKDLVKHPVWKIEELLTSYPEPA